MPRVKMPTGEVVDMPDNPTPEQLASLASLHGQQPAQPPVAARSGPQESLHRAGVLARGLATGPTSTFGMLGDALNTGVNMAGRAIGHDPQLAMPSQVLQQGMDKIGLPRAENTTEHVVEGLASMATGSKDPIMSAVTRMLPAAARPVLSERQKALMAGQREGYTALPSELGSRTGAQFEHIAGKKELTASMGRHNQNLTDKLARKVTGLPPDTPLTEELIGNAMTATRAAGYEPIKQIGNITTGSVYRKALDKAILDNHGNSSFPFSQDVKKLVDSYRLPNFDSADAIDTIQRLRSQAYNRMLDPNVRGASRDVATALEKNIELNLSSRGAPAAEMLAKFRDARKQLAKQGVVMEALERGTGNVNNLKIAGKLQRNGENYLTDELKTMGTFAKNASAVSGIPQAAAGAPFAGSMHHNVLTGLAGIFGGGIPAAAMATLPLGQAGLRQALMSQTAQRAMGPRLDPRLLNRLIHNKGVVNAMPAAMQQSGLFSPEQ